MSVVNHEQDAALLERAARGDAEAFASLFRRRQADVYRFALHMTASPSIADDVTQDVFLTVMREAGRYEAQRATVIAWLCGIARNHVRRRLERDRMLQPFDEDESSDEGIVDMTRVDDGNLLEDLTKAESLEALHRAVLSLPVRYREALVLCDLQELTYAEAAVAVGCAIGTVRSRLHRARTLLASKLTAADATSAEPNANRPAAESSRPPEGLSRMRRSLA